MKQVLIDLTYIVTEKDLNKSTSIYLQRFLSNVIKDDDIQYSIIGNKEVVNFFRNKFDVIKASYIFEAKKIGKFRPHFIASILISVLWKLKINKINPDVIFCPFCWIYNCRKLRCKKITVIHDLKPIKELSSKYINSKFENIILRIYKFYFNKSVKTSNKILVISDFVKNDVEKTFPMSKGKTITVYNGVPFYNQKKEINILANKKFILYVNTFQPYKNAITLIKAFNQLDSNDIYLVLVGKETSYWKNECEPLCSDKTIRLNYVTDEELNWLYCNALLFVTTSLKEGFGFTPVEAAIRNTPVISTKCESLPEVTMGMVNYYDNPLDDLELVKEIERVLGERNQDNYRIKLEKISKELRNRYSVENFSANIVNILKGDDKNES